MRVAADEQVLISLEHPDVRKVIEETEPSARAVSLHGLDQVEQYASAKVVDLAATLHGRSRSDLDGEDVRQHRRTMRIAWGAGLALFTLLALGIAAGWIARQEQKAKEIQRELAAARRLILAAESARGESAAQLELSGLLAMEAMRRVEALGCDVVEEGQRTRVLHGQVVEAVVDQIASRAPGSVPFDRQMQLGAQ